MATLRVNDVVCKQVDWADLRQFIQESYKLPLCLLDWDADMRLLKLTVAERTLGEWEANRLQHFQNTGRGRYILHDILTDLCNKGLLDPCEYIITNGGE